MSPLRRRPPYHGLAEASTPGDDDERAVLEQREEDVRQDRLIDQDEDRRDGADRWEGLR